MKKVVILTGNELRHCYFRHVISNDRRFRVVGAFCEGLEKSLENQVHSDPVSNDLLKLHVQTRTQSESDFFKKVIDLTEDRSNPVLIQAGEINDQRVVDQVIGLNADLLVCYGSSLVKSELLSVFQGRFLNVHLGLSPYYRGSGTNIWPMINDELEYVGATFMYIDAGVDTGDIIHQIRAAVHPGDGPHQIGNRLIVEMADIYAEIIACFDRLEKLAQPPKLGGRVYKSKDFNNLACEKLYENFRGGMVERYLSRLLRTKELAPILTNSALRVSK